MIVEALFVKIFKKKTFSYIGKTAIDDYVPCPAKNQDMYGNDYAQYVVGSWKECGEF